MQNKKTFLLPLLGSACLYSISSLNANEVHENLTNTSSSSSSESEVHSYATPSKLVETLKQEHRKGLNQRNGKSNHPIGMGLGLISSMAYDLSISWLDEPSRWATANYDKNYDDSISEGAVNLLKVKRKALNLEKESVEILLNCYLYSKFGINISNVFIQKEFSFLLELFSSEFPEMCKSLKEKFILKNIEGLPLNDKEIMETYTLLKAQAEQMGVSARLKEIPYCYLASFELETIKSREMPASKKLKQEGSHLETQLKKVGSGKITTTWYNMIYNHSALLTSDNDSFHDDTVLEGQISLGNLKKKVLNGNYSDFEMLILAYKDHKFKLPIEDYVAQEATEWLSLFVGTLVHEAQFSKIVDLYGKALTENWFGKISRGESGALESHILEQAARRGNLAARGLLTLPPFSNHRELSEQIRDGEEIKAKSFEKKDDDCIIS